MAEHDPARLQEIIDKQRKVFDRIDERDVALFIAHTEHGKSIRQLAKQTVERKPKNIRKIVQYVRTQLQHELDVDYS